MAGIRRKNGRASRNIPKEVKANRRSGRLNPSYKMVDSVLCCRGRYLHEQAERSSDKNDEAGQSGKTAVVPEKGSSSCVGYILG
jgi:hypothetical protein